MAPSEEAVARDIAVAFYTHLLAGRPVAQALFHARTSTTAEGGTPMLFAMAGYPDSCFTDADVSPEENSARSKRRRPRRS